MNVLSKLFITGLMMSVFVACGESPNFSDPIPLVADATTTSRGITPVQTELHGKLSPLLARPQMVSARAAHTATLLPDGTVLLTGGMAQSEQALATAELFDPQSRSFSSIEPMTQPRQSHSATRLPDGKVLLAGGFSGGPLASAELFDPASGTYLPTGEMTVPRSGHTAVLLQNGLVLLVGGTSTGWEFLSSAELYDPKSGTFSVTGEMTFPRESHTATLLNTGQVLITGGHQGRRSALTIYTSAELYDPLSETFALTGEMTVRRHKHEATLLSDGRVFISGGADERDAQGAYRSTEIYHPRMGTFTPAANMHHTRYKHQGATLLLDNGEVLLLGGAASPEIFDPHTGEMRKVVASLPGPRYFARATLLANGEILFSGGYGQKTLADQQAWLLQFP